MCGRVTLYADPQAVAALFSILEPTFEWEPRYNVAPTQSVVACRTSTARSRELVRLRWGLVPSWASDLSAGFKAINARAETIAEKPFFRSAFKQRRCLIPVSGFYEWQTTGKQKQPYFIHPAAGELFAFAGLWERWMKGGDPVESASIITTAANETMRPLHERMPVILSPESFAAWLDLSTPSGALLDLLRPCLAESLALHPVDSRVGNVRNQGPELIAPVHALFAS